MGYAAAGGRHAQQSGGFSAGASARATADVSLPSRAATQQGAARWRSLPGGFGVSSPAPMGPVAPTLVALVLIEAAVLVWARRSTRNYHGG